MNYLKKLKTETITKLLPLVILFAFVGGLCLAGSNLFAEEPEARYLHDVPRNQLEGAYVTVNLDYIYGCYAYTEEYEDNKPTGRITEREYLIDANEYDYMCVILSGDLMDKAEILLKQSDEYYYGERETITASFVITGKVRPLTLESKNFLHDAVDYDSLDAATQDTYLPLYLDPVDYSVQTVPLIFAVIFLGAAIIMLVLGITGWYQRQVKERLLQYFGSYTDKSDEFMNYMLSLQNVKGLRVGAGYMLLRQGYSHYLLDGNDIVWAYQQVTRQKLYGIIPLGKTFALMLKTADGKQKLLQMSEAQVKTQLQLIAQHFPTVAIGYSAQLQNMFQNNPASLREVAASQRAR